MDNDDLRPTCFRAIPGFFIHGAVQDDFGIYYNVRQELGLGF